MTVAHDALVAVRSLQIGMLAEKVRDLGLDRLGQQSTRPIAQDFGELIVEDSWLNQMDNVIVGHGISLLRWRSGGVKHPHDMPPSRFPPSPTFRDSSRLRASPDDDRLHKDSCFSRDGLRQSAGRKLANCRASNACCRHEHAILATESSDLAGRAGPQAAIPGACV